MEKATIENFKKVFRFHKGEKENPYDISNGADYDNRHLGMIWLVENALDHAPAAKVVELWNECAENAPKEITEADKPLDERVCALYVFIAGDSFFAPEAIRDEYLKTPVVRTT